MFKFKRPGPVIINALIWAAIMIASAFILKGVEADHKNMLLILQVAGWMTIHSTLTNNNSSCKKD